MTEADTVLVERDGPITIVSINRPHCRNAVDGATARKLYDAFLAFDADESASVAVFTGTGGEDAGASAAASVRGVGVDTASPDVPTTAASSAGDVALSGAGWAVETSAVTIEIGYESSHRGCSTHDASTIAAKAAAAARCGPTCHARRRAALIRRPACSAASSAAISGASGSRSRISSIATAASRSRPSAIAPRARGSRRRTGRPPCPPREGPARRGARAARARPKIQGRWRARRSVRRARQVYRRDRAPPARR